MFIGHLAVAFAAKRAEPRLSLPLLFVAAEFCDILFPLCILFGIEHSRIVPGITAASPLDLYDVPYSHGLATSLLWAVLFALPWWLKLGRRAGAVVGAAVFSHFVLDWITHRPDLPLAPGLSFKLGLGLWHSAPLSILVEAALFAAGVWLYVSRTHATRRMGSMGLWVLIGVLPVLWLGAQFGPPPLDIRAVAISILVVTVIVVIWGRAIDRARMPDTPA
jgi:hypothetical protein